jgi:hypothetical protein
VEVLKDLLGILAASKGVVLAVLVNVLPLLLHRLAG